MGLGQSSGFLGVVYKIRLTELFGMVTDDLDGVFVCTNGSVGAKSPEFTVNRIGTTQLFCFIYVQ